MNGADAGLGDALVAGRDHTWSLSAGGAGQVSGVFSPECIPAKLDTDALLQIREMFDVDGDFGGLCANSPLVPGLHEELSVNPFERRLEHRLVFLERTCANPRMRLELATELLPTSRARRISRGAIARLASHREDWERPTALGIHPKRVLCDVSEDSADIYENRLVASLVDHLISYLRHRMLRIASIKRMLEQIGDHSVDASVGTFRRRNRLFELWAESTTGDLTTEVALEVEARVGRIYSRICALTDSALYRSIPRTSSINGLRYTNLFTGDPDYRKVAEIWQDWAKSRLGASTPESDSQYFHRQQRICDAMARFGWLLVGRALRQLGMSSSGMAGDSFHLRGPIADCTIERPGATAFSVVIRDREIRVVCLPSSIPAASSAVHEAFLRDLADSTKSMSCDQILLLHLPPRASGDGAVEEARSLLHWEPGPLHSNRLACIPTSPWSLGSVERVARYFRWHVHGPPMLEYPPAIRLPPSSAMVQPEWMRATTSRSEWLGLRRPRPGEITDRAVLQAISAHLGSNPNPKLGKAARHAQDEMRRAASEAQSALIDAFARIDRLAICPVCSHTGLLAPTGDGSCFESECAACDARWAVYRCACGERFPVILPQGCCDLLNAWVARKSANIDEALGCDVLAIPFIRNSGSVGFHCPACSGQGETR